MSGISKHIIFFIFGIIPLMSFSQNTESSKVIEAIIEGQLENLDRGTNVGLIIEDLEELAETPININSTNEAELSRLYLLNDIQIEKLLQYIREFGSAYSIFELNTIDGFTPEILSKISPFIYFGEPDKQKQKFSESIKYSKQQLLLRGLGTLQKAKGYSTNEDDSTPYNGNQYRYYARYRFQAKDKISAGFTAEKDPGEAFFSGSNKSGFDFYSGHLSAKISETIENITIGDYLVRSGQGLVLWQEYSMGKSENILNISKTNRGIRPFTSVEENLFF